MKPFTITIQGVPKVKGRPRLGRRGRVFTPVATQEAEAIIAETWRNASGPKFNGPLNVEVDFHLKETIITVSESEHELSRLRGDVDNYLKLVMDGLNTVAWDDDKQVVWIYAVKHND